jgi:membrane protein CcdC involved in cytochrome C biogenesis
MNALPTYLPEFLAWSILKALLLGLMFAVLLRAAAYWVSKTHVRFLRAYGLSVLLSGLGSVCNFWVFPNSSTLAPVNITVLNAMLFPSGSAARCLTVFLLFRGNRQRAIRTIHQRA